MCESGLPIAALERVGDLPAALSGGIVPPCLRKKGSRRSCISTDDITRRNPRQIVVKMPDRLDGAGSLSWMVELGSVSERRWDGLQVLDGDN